jgi:hypothetical protein
MNLDEEAFRSSPSFKSSHVGQLLRSWLQPDSEVSLK